MKKNTMRKAPALAVIIMTQLESTIIKTLLDMRKIKFYCR